MSGVGDFHPFLWDMLAVEVRFHVRTPKKDTVRITKEKKSRLECRDSIF